ncbi:MAG: hypothetical protein L6Q66_08010 [Bacteroidia bacterium]|nr:hypothetical protein [Bacteroidia bacterium]
MSKFALELIEEITGKQKFYKLLSDGTCEFDAFWKKYEKDSNLRSQLAKIQTRLMALANLQYEALDRTKFRELGNRKGSDPYKDYEIKTKNLRLYFFKDDGTGQVIVIGGTKDSQDEDIKRMRIIKMEYFKNK